MTQANATTRGTASTDRWQRAVTRFPRSHTITTDIKAGNGDLQELPKRCLTRGEVSSQMTPPEPWPCNRERTPQVAGLPRGNDTIQTDVFYCRDVIGANHAILGIIDQSTPLHQACRLKDMSSNHTLEIFRNLWFQALRLSCNHPDRSWHQLRPSLQALRRTTWHMAGSDPGRGPLAHRTHRAPEQCPERHLGEDHRCRVHLRQRGLRPSHQGARHPQGRGHQGPSRHQHQPGFVESSFEEDCNFQPHGPPARPELCILEMQVPKGRSTKKKGAWIVARFLSYDPDGKSACVHSGTTTVHVASRSSWLRVMATPK